MANTMASQYKMDRKNMGRREESRRVREERIITGYVKNSYPNIYKEARQFFSYLDSLYPGKNDLRKTNEYAAINHESNPKKYYPRKYYPRKQKEKLRDTMVLRIPLMGKNNTNTESVDIPLYSQQEGHLEMETTTAETTQEGHLEMETTTAETTQEGHLEMETTTAETTQEGHLEMETTTAETTQDAQTQTTTAETTQEGHLELIDEQTLADIIQDLSEDPDFRNMFDNFEYEYDNCPLW